MLKCHLAFALAMLPFASAGPARDAGQDAAVRAQIEQLAEDGEFQAGMALAHKITDDPGRFALEADLLFRARSYRSALGRALEAHAGGVQTALLLARGIGSALWLGDGASARTFLPDFDAAIAALPEAEQSAWSDYAADLRGQVEALEAQKRDVHARVGLAKKVALLTLGFAVVLMAWLRPRSSE